MNKEELRKHNEKIRELMEEDDKVHEIHEIIENHRIWIKSNHKEGQPANLSGKDLSMLKHQALMGGSLSDMDLRGTCIRDMDLVFADFHNSDLRGADLSGSILRRAEFIGTDLRRADLSGADLKQADLTGAIINRDQIDDLLKGLGVVVEDE